jgi:outer membrane lipoprotein carrier protein
MGSASSRQRVRTMRQYVVLCMCALAIAPAAWSQRQVDDLGQELVDRFLTEVITLEGSFEQSLIDAGGEVVERTSGTLEVERPGRFRWAYTEPYEQWLIADGVNVWSYDVDLAQVTVKPQAEALANTPALLLGGGTGALEQFEYGGAVEEAGTTWVRMLPKDTDSGFVRLEMGFFDGQLSRMVFFDNLEQTTLVALYDVRINEPIDDARFEFAVPDDVDLVGVPATVDEALP